MARSLLALLLVFCAVLATAQKMRGGSFLFPEAERKRFDAHMALLNQGLQAEREGKLQEAEALLRRLLKEWPGSFKLAQGHLAQIVDRQGSSLEALELYNQAYGPRWSGVGGDDRALVRYGDLCVEFERTKDAFEIYAAIAKRFDRDHAPRLPALTLRRGTLDAFRAAAYTAVAHRYAQIADEDRARRCAEIAIGADPKAWQAHYFLARWLQGDEALRHADEAERLVPDRDRWYVTRLLKERGWKRAERPKATSL